MNTRDHRALGRGRWARRGLSPRRRAGLALAALLGGSVAPLVTGQSAHAAAPTSLHVDFGPSTSTRAPGYLADWGQPYAARTGVGQGSGLSYGWVADGTGTALDATGRTRTRTGTGTQADARAVDYVLMQPGGLSAGAWEVAVANGTYVVGVGVGDAGAYYDSVHRIVAESTAVLAPFTPTNARRQTIATATVTVTDGRLTLRATGGTNTKLDFVDVEPAAPASVPVPAPAFPVRVDFGALTTAPASGYVLDAGRAFAARTTEAPGTGLAYGWVAAATVADGATAAGLDLSLNGRQRSVAGWPDPRTASFVHLQYNPVLASALGTSTVGAWELAVPSGTYAVTVAVGDPSSYNDSSHRIVAEDVPVLGPVTPVADARVATATEIVTVTDGRLTLSPTGGTNTKIDYVEVVPSADTTTPTFPLQVDQASAAVAPAPGYLPDSGAAYGRRPGGRSYGWVLDGTTTPVDRSGLGRVRTGTATTDVRLTGFAHMQPTDGAAAAWEAEVPNGPYKVTVALGDAGPYYDSTHAVSVEGLPATAPLKPDATHRFSTSTLEVTVTDGRVTIRPTGVNTKLDYVVIEQIDPRRPRVIATTPADQAYDVVRDGSITATVALPGGAIDATTVTPSTVLVTDVTTGLPVAGSVNTSGGGDILVFTPTTPFAADHLLRFEVTDGVHDGAGAAFIPWVSTFTTGTKLSGTGIAGVAFTQTTVATGSAWTSIAMGPDGKLYAVTIDGFLHRWTVQPDGTLSGIQVFSTIRTLHGGVARTIIGLAFDPASTPTNPIVWLTDNYPYNGNDDIPDWGSQLVRLSGPNLADVKVVVTGLPRSAHDHETNSIAFGPDGALYVVQGSNSGMGAPDLSWGNRPESLLTAAVLRLDPAKLPATLPLDVRTPEGGGTYSPYAPGAALTLYATGIRNAFDLVWHSNGRLYAPTNGSAAGSNLPGVPDPLPASCASLRPDLSVNGPWTFTGVRAPAVNGNPVDQPDWIYRITKGGYYGHPDPVRCEFVAHGGNPTSGTDPWEERAYPVGVLPDRNYRASDVFVVSDHASANGTIEYASSAFGGKLRGKLLVVRFSAGKDVAVATVRADGGIDGITTGVSGLSGFDQPLDLAQDPATGRLWITELSGRRIRLLAPATS